MYHIRILIPRVRDRHGVLTLTGDDGDRALLPPALCYGKADNARAAAEGNPSRDPTRPYGDTPAGFYRATRLVRFATPHPRMGRAWIPMLPLPGEFGQAALAAERGREGLGIHAGRGDSELIATYGCVRLRDADFDVLARRLGDGWLDIAIEEVE